MSGSMSQSAYGQQQQASQSHNRIASTSSARNFSASGSQHLSPQNASGSSNNGGGIPPFASPYGASPSSSSAKESFLNYFFGGSEHGAPVSSGTGSSGGSRSQLPDMAGNVRRQDRSDNPLTGRRGLEGNAAAFDMKSLDKHLEAVSGGPAPVR